MKFLFIRLTLMMFVIYGTLSSANTDKVDALLKKWDRDDSPGCAISIIKNGKVIYSRGYGMANIEKRIKITPKTVFSIASTSKQFTAFCIALINQSSAYSLSLQDDIRFYIPELPDYGTKITIAHLVYHTSGLPDYLKPAYQFSISAKYGKILDSSLFVPQEIFEIFTVNGFSLSSPAAVLTEIPKQLWLISDNLQKHWFILKRTKNEIKVSTVFKFTSPIKQSELINYIATLKSMKKLKFSPGKKHNYSNTNYALLAWIIEKVTRMTLREFANKQIFQPLNMSHTHFDDRDEPTSDDHAKGYFFSKKKGYTHQKLNCVIVGDGGLLTTTENLYHWDNNFYNNQLSGGQKLINQIITPGKVEEGENDYAFGLTIWKWKKIQVISHAGEFGGFQAEIMRFPEHKLTVICLANASDLNAEIVAFKIAKLYLSNS